MENGGNKKVNSIFEAHLRVPKPEVHASGPERERFIRDKYERHKFYDAGVLQRYYEGGTVEEESSSEESSENESPRRQPRNQKTASIPSEAARRRVEARKKRFGQTAAAVQKPKASVSVSAPVAVEVDLLGFDMPTPAPAPAPAPAPDAPAPISAPPPAPSTSIDASPQLDLFADMNLSGNGQPRNGNNGGQTVAATSSKSVKSNDDILAMFAPNPVSAQPQQNHGFGSFGNAASAPGANMGMASNIKGNNMMMMGGNAMGGSMMQQTSGNSNPNASNSMQQGNFPGQMMSGGGSGYPMTSNMGNMHQMGGASMMVNSQGFPLSGSGSTGNGNVNMMGGMGLNNQSFNQGYNNHAGNAQQVSMGQPQQANVMVDQASMGGMGGFHGMGGAPMGGASMGGAPMGGASMGGAPMGGAPMGGASMAGSGPMGGSSHDQFSNFTPWG